jgi:multidrug efflux pump subunit AcrA (membrane-fusion protein)
MRIRAVFPNHDLLLQPGIFGKISIPGSPLYKGILIPDEAIASDQDRRIVYVLDDANVVSAQVIRPGPRIDGYRVVRTGLTGMERIVVDGLTRVRPGVKVDPAMVDLPPIKP